MVNSDKEQKKLSILQKQEEAKLFETVMDEIANDKRQKGLWGQAIVKSNGDEKKAESEYIKLRVESLKDKKTITKLNKEIKEEEKRLIKEEKEEKQRLTKEKLEYNKIQKLMIKQEKENKKKLEIAYKVKAREKAILQKSKEKEASISSLKELKIYNFSKESVWINSIIVSVLLYNNHYVGATVFSCILLVSLYLCLLFYPSRTKIVRNGSHSNKLMILIFIAVISFFGWAIYNKIQ
jgi:hypothetical protein